MVYRAELGVRTINSEKGNSSLKARPMATGLFLSQQTYLFGKNLQFRLRTPDASGIKDKTSTTVRF